MLLRRVRQRAQMKEIQFVGTSATLSSEGTREEQRKKVAEVGSTIFGVTVPSENIVGETLERIAKVPCPASQEDVGAAVKLPPPAADAEAVANHPLAAWVEEHFGLAAADDGRLVRRRPIEFETGLKLLIEESGLPEESCRKALKAVLEAGADAPNPRTEESLFAFRLHQFFSSGGAVYSTLGAPEGRKIGMEGHYSVAVQHDGTQEEHVNYPLAFCRHCGQEYYLATLQEIEGEERLVPRSPILDDVNDETAEAGFFCLDEKGLWSGNEEDLPDGWCTVSKKGALKLKKDFEKWLPRRYSVMPDGLVGHSNDSAAVTGWFQMRPLRLCLRCRQSYDGRERNDYKKLSTLSQLGRSSAATVTALASILGLREQEAVEPAARKILSFTDNRQDASLQAGHLNDFTQVLVLRGALVRALEKKNDLTWDELGGVMFEALDLSPEQFMKVAAPVGSHAYNQARKAMMDLLAYRVLEDLGRGWRITQPNLEQCGLLHIDYAGLGELAGDEKTWASIPLFQSASPERRSVIIRSILDFLREALILDAKELTRDETNKLVKRVGQELREPWAMEEDERPELAGYALLPGQSDERLDQPVRVKLGSRSAIFRFLRSRHTWENQIQKDLKTDEAQNTFDGLLDVLKGHFLTFYPKPEKAVGVQVKVSTLRWRKGDGVLPPLNPVRAKSAHLIKDEHRKTEPNRYFVRAYQEQAARLAGILSREHTGQVSTENRVIREEDFREGRLPVLFCSPTMELGVDIRDLYAVHLRNVPPTPANYAQRAGRAGRGGRPALVMVFSGFGSTHDQHFFRNRVDMIAGEVSAPRIDLANRDLVRAHLHSVWLWVIGADLGRTMQDVLDLDKPGYPIKPDMMDRIAPTPARITEVTKAYNEVASLLGINEPWLSPEAVGEFAKEAKSKFDEGLGRWRELFCSTEKQRDEARKIIDSYTATPQQKSEAEKREQEAKRQLSLLLNQSRRPTESDFYPYRYLANEGFIPGYNFPRLPLRAFVSSAGDAQSIDRPRFLGLYEFGPHNILYHEGKKHAVVGCFVPPDGLESRFLKAQACTHCGHLYVPPKDGGFQELCGNCGATLGGNGGSAEIYDALFEQTDVRTWGRNRISSEEEERTRWGYQIITGYELTPETRTKRIRYQRASDSADILGIVSHPQAWLWRINSKLRKSQDTGFLIDAQTGEWLTQEEVKGGKGEGRAIARVMPFVKDTRNVILLRPEVEMDDQESFLKTLAHAFREAVLLHYQLEEQEIQVELIGDGDEQRILLWETAEGGSAAWSRLAEQPGELRLLAEAALRLCHFDPENGWKDQASEKCLGACYDCLLSYSNQPDHRLLRRHSIRDLLVELTTAGATVVGAKDYDKEYERLLELCDSKSPLERKFIEALHEKQLALPTHAQYQPPGNAHVQVDFFYERPGTKGICVFIDGSVHDTAEQEAKDKVQRDSLVEQGYKVIVIRYQEPLESQLVAHSDVFTSHV